MSTPIDARVAGPVFKARIFREETAADGTVTLRPVTTARWLTVMQVAAALGVSRMTVYRWIDEGRMKAMRFSPGLLRVSAETVAGFVKDAEDRDV